IDRNSPLSILAHLRHELRTPINAIIGYGEMLLEELEATNGDAKSIDKLQQIRESGVQLLATINLLLNPSPTEESQVDLNKILTNPRLQTELTQLTQEVIECCQQLISSLEADWLADLNKIQTAANRLLSEVNSITNVFLIESPEDTISLPEITKSEIVIFQDVTPPQNTITPISVNQDRDTILVVDDNETNRDLLSRQVKAQGYEAVTAANGQQAMNMIKTGIYDLILLDIMMPEIDGYQVLQWIRDSSWRHIPVIVISALDEIDSVVKCIEMGAEDYLSKPFNPTLLKARVGACLSQKRLRDRESQYLDKLAQANQQITNLNQRLQAENSRLSAELEVTHRLQTMLLPKEKELSQIDDLEIAGFMQPAEEVGGDYYDVLQHNQNRVTIGIGDVTGHGLESGVLMLMVQTAVRTLMENNETDPKKFFEVLNRTIYKNVQRMNSDKNLTLCLIDYQQGRLSLSGQHEEMLVVRSGEEVERIDTIDLGFPIGLSETIEDFVFQVEVNLAPGDVVILYTDGITEAENNLGVQYGLDRLCNAVRQNWSKSAQEIRQLVIEDLRSHIGVQKIYDDITLVVLKQK
ncbi:MAG: SpoIIE family protein phosphatase, partial [Pleurocapsa sp.]